MVEPEGKSDFLAPEVKPAAVMMRVSDGKSTNSTDKPAHSLHQPHQLLHTPTHHFGPGHHAEVRNRENLGAWISFSDSIGLKILMK